MTYHGVGRIYRLQDKRYSRVGALSEVVSRLGRRVTAFVWCCVRSKACTTWVESLLRYSEAPTESPLQSIRLLTQYRTYYISQYMPRKLYSFAIDEELADALKRLKARDGAPESESIRRALALYLTQKGVMKKQREKSH